MDKSYLALKNLNQQFIDNKIQIAKEEDLLKNLENELENLDFEYKELEIECEKTDLKLKNVTEKYKNGVDLKEYYCEKRQEYERENENQMLRLDRKLQRRAKTQEGYNDLNKQIEEMFSHRQDERKNRIRLIPYITEKIITNTKIINNISEAAQAPAVVHLPIVKTDNTFEENENKRIGISMDDSSKKNIPQQQSNVKKVTFEDDFLKENIPQQNNMKKVSFEDNTLKKNVLQENLNKATFEDETLKQNFLQDNLNKDTFENANEKERFNLLQQDFENITMKREENQNFLYKENDQQQQGFKEPKEIIEQEDNKFDSFNEFGENASEDSTVAPFNFLQNFGDNQTGATDFLGQMNEQSEGSKAVKDDNNLFNFGFGSNDNEGPGQFNFFQAFENSNKEKEEESKGNANNNMFSFF